MDGQRFDSLARKLGAGANRRTVLRGLIGGGAALAAMKTGSVLAAPADKVTICHWSEDLGSYEQISVSQNAVPAHEAHGMDIIRPDFTSAETCGDCNTTCDEFDNSFCNEGLCDCTPNVCGDDQCGMQPSGCGGEVDCGACVECDEAPVALLVDVVTYAVPEELKVTCFNGPNSPSGAQDTGALCPVIEECGTIFVPFSYDDNRFSLGIAAYGSGGTLLGYIEAPGTRYVYAATVDADAGTVTFFGQGGTETTLTWAQLDALAGA